jgi:hypothetical protein
MHTLITIILLPAIRPARDIIVVPTSKGTRIHALLLIGIIPASKRARVLALLIRVHASLLPLVGAVLGELLFSLVEEIHLCGLLVCVEEGRYGDFYLYSWGNEDDVAWKGRLVGERSGSLSIGRDVTYPTTRASWCLKLGGEAA